MVGATQRAGQGSGCRSVTGQEDETKKKKLATTKAQALSLHCR